MDIVDEGASSVVNKKNHKQIYRRTEGAQDAAQTFSYDAVVIKELQV